MKKTKTDDDLYAEISPEKWAEDTVNKLDMLHDLKTKYINFKTFDFNSNAGDKIFKIISNQNKVVKFDIETENGKITLNGVYLKIIPCSEMRNQLDYFFIPIENLVAFKVLDSKKRAGILEMLKLGHFINIGTITNITE